MSLLTLFTPFSDILAATIAPPTSQAPNNADLSFGKPTWCFWIKDREESSARRMCEPKALPLRVYICQSNVRCDARYAARAYTKLIPSWLNLLSLMATFHLMTSWSRKQGLNTGRCNPCRNFQYLRGQATAGCNKGGGFYFERKKEGKFWMWMPWSQTFQGCWERNEHWASESSSCRLPLLLQRCPQLTNRGTLFNPGNNLAPRPTKQRESICLQTPSNIKHT